MLVGEVFARMGLDSKQYEKDLSRLEGATKREATTLGGIFNNAFSVALGIGVFEAIQRGFQAVVGGAVNFNSMMEQAQIGFTTMLGSSEKAQAFLEKMGYFAARTPFEFPELLQSAKRMLAMGFAASDILPTLETIGNAAAGLGIGGEGINRITLALGQMKAKSKVSAEEMLQLTEAGVSAWQMLAEAMGKTTGEVMKMAEKGLIPADKAIKILTDGMNKRFPNMMQNMENTWQGVTSTIKDVWRMTIGALTKTLFSGTVDWLKTVRDRMTSFYNLFSSLESQGVGVFTALKLALANTFGAEFAVSVNIAVGALQGLWNTAKAVVGGIAENWALIKFVSIAFLTYALTTRIATGATAAFRTVSLLLSGNLAAQSGILGFLSNVIVYYKVQMLEAAATTNIFTGALVRLRAAIYAVHLALGPIGWIILGLSAAVGVGTHLWSKYAASVEKANLQKVLQAVSGQDTKLADSSQQAAKGLQDQADATKEAGKAASKNLQAFDEVHQLMEDTAGAAEDITKGLDQVAMPALETPGAMALPGLDTSALEQAKPTLSGFWEWMKQGFGNMWEGVKTKWNGFWSWVKGWGLWTWIGDRWDGLKEWGGNIWEGVKDKWQGFKSWVGSWAGPLWDGVKTKWGDFKEWAANMWEGAKVNWGNFTDWVQGKWSSFRANAGEIWQGIKTNVQTRWEELKTNAPIIWEDIKTNIQTRWDKLKTGANTAWSNIATTIGTKWNEMKTNAPTVWENIKTNINDRWDNLVTGASEKWENIKTSISDRWRELNTEAPTTWENIKQNISDRWEVLKSNAPLTWEDIKKAISDRWEALKTEAPTTWGRISGTLENTWENIKQTAQDKWEGVKTVIKGAINGIIGFVNKFIQAFNRIEIRVPSVNIPLVGTVGGWPVRVPQINEIPPLATGTNYVPQDMLAYLHEGEAVVPKKYNPEATEITPEAMEQAVYRAFTNALRIMQASARQDDRELVLKIDNTVLARMQLPAIIREGQRQGLNLILRPQGV